MLDRAGEPERSVLWRADIDACERLLVERHAGLSTFVSRDQLHASFDALRADLPALRDDQIVVRLKCITTSIGSAHTGAWPSRGALVPRRLPLELRWLSDGVLVTATDETNALLRGGIVVRIGDHDIGEVLDAVSRVSPHENEWYLRVTAARSLMEAETLSGLGLVLDPDRIPISVLLADGREVTAVVQPTAHGSRAVLIPAVSSEKCAWSLGPRPEGRRHGSRLLADSGVLYIWYDQCEDDRGHTIKDFARATLREIDAERPRAVVVDLRRNGGGNSGLLGPLIGGLADRPGLDAPDRLFVLIGPGTFSSAGLNAEEFRSRTRATLVGEPTGQRPDSWMECRWDWLPNSLIQVNYMLVAPSFRANSPTATEPDVLVPRTVADGRIGRDAALERAIELAPPARTRSDSVLPESALVVAHDRLIGEPP